MHQDNLWSVAQSGFRREDIEKHGSKFIIGNGYLGVRGTLEEFGKAELAACTLSGLYDQVGDKWREPVNAPHAFGARVFVGGAPLSVLTTPVAAHRQSLDLRQAVHERETVFRLDDGNEIIVRARRFLSAADPHLGVFAFAMTVSHACRVAIETGVDGDVWDINGPHLQGFESVADGEVRMLTALTGEQCVRVAVAEALHSSRLPIETATAGEKGFVRRFDFDAAVGTEYSFVKYISIYTGRDGSADPDPAALADVRRAAGIGYEALLAASRREWDARWRACDVCIEGDDEAQLALRYSIYQLLIIAPVSDCCSIPARGLSGQVYKGGVFWDTEIFMSPFFDHTWPEVGKKLMRYRVRTLDGARRKAVEYGHRGAFYAWESQETGDDACTHFNVTDVHTGRPMRTHFRDKQVHISADVALAIWRHHRLTGDDSVLLEGGAEAIFECARFFVSYAWFKPEKNRYEILDVIGPDEYHERVDNNAFTSAMVAATLRIALDVVSLFGKRHPLFLRSLLDRLDYETDLARLRDVSAKLWRPAPDPETGVIEQFTGYHRLEDSTPAELKKRMLKPNEYWGGGHGLATTTQVIKQADVVLMLHLVSEQYSEEVKRANWDHYEPRTEHGSSLSPCVYALLAAELGRVEWAYKYFLRTATIDLTGESKQYVGTLYIGGTHPAANGGAWMAAVLGFGGLRLRDDTIHLCPRLPAKWHRIAFRFCWRGQWFSADVTPERVAITADQANTAAGAFMLVAEARTCAPGETVSIALAEPVPA